MLSGLAPWIVYWVLVGNVPFGAAVLAALAIASAGLVIGRTVHERGKMLEICSVVTFSVLTLLTFVLDDSFLQRWILPLSIAGLLLAALIGALIGRPFVREFAAAEQPPDVVKTELFGRAVAVLTWGWVATLAAMTVSSAIPPITDRSPGMGATLLDTKTPLSFVCYWVIPFTLLGLAALASRLLPARLLAGIERRRPGDLVRRLRRGHHRRALLPGPRARQPRSRSRQGGLQRQGRGDGDAPHRRRVPQVVALHLQGPRQAALTHLRFDTLV